MRTLALLITLSSLAAAADPTAVRAELQPAKIRHPAPAFALKDASGKTSTLRDYRGKLLLIDFWATWCHGCKEEIPWFADLANKYRAKGLVVVGISLDDDGWKVLNPFLASAKMPYTILLGDDAISKRYGIESMPDTFLIDRKGNLAASYTGGLVDRKNLESNIQLLLK
jgi:cytochrome c biogenesis protein CcmG/thiol:disulfide interchange protein DsbE